MLRSVINRGESLVSRLIRSFFPPGPHPEVALAVCGYQYPRAAPTSPTDDGILWTAPRDRRSREKRLTRKFGSENGHKKMLPVLRLLTCNSCGHVHEPERLCPHCYGKIQEVTIAMQEAMNATHGLKPIDKEVIPVFQGEELGGDKEFFQGKRIVEVPKTRPQWFSSRLKQKSNVGTSESTTVSETGSLG